MFQQVVKNAASVKKDHPEKRNYDDFNEFFWSPLCLDCCYTEDPRSAARVTHTRALILLNDSLSSIVLSTCV